MRRSWLGRAVRSPGIDEYVPEYGSSRRKKVDVKVITAVPTASKRRKWLVLSLKAMAERVEKKKALSPKAARGNAVAEPRWDGKLEAAMSILSVARGIS